MPANDSYWRNLKKMHVVFVLSAIGLLAVTLWMMWKDHAGEWHEYQSTFDKIEDLRIRRLIELDANSAYEDKKKELKKQLKEATAKYEDNKGDVEDDIKEAQLQFDKASRDLRTKRAYRDKARADYDLAIRDEKSELAKAG